MKVVVDRLVQYPNRFQLVNVDTSEVLGVFDLSAVTGTIQQVGTEINAELFDSIQDDLTQLAQNIVEESNARGVDVNALQNSIATKITANGGELGNAVVSFTEISNATNIASGEKASILFGKIRNWFSRLKALAFKDTIADSDISSTANIAQSKVSGLTAIQSKLNGIDAGANKYTLPIATANALGGVKVGSRLSVATDGTISADVQSDTNFTQNEKSKLNGIESGANRYILPNATANLLGGVKVGDRLSIVDGVLSANLQSDANFTQNEKTKLSVLSNPNILINSNFAINQRGIYTDNTSARFMADRWYKQVTNLASVSFDGEECTITLLSDRSSKTPILRQIIEDGYKYVGKSLTFSLDVISTTSTYYISIVYYNANGAYVSESAYGLTATATGRISVSTNSVPNNTSKIRVTINAYANGLTGDKFVFKYPKLEEGSVATMYVTPIYEEELLKCQSLESDYVKLLRTTNISTTYPLSQTSASDEKILSEKAIFGKLVTLSEIYSVVLSDGDDLDLMVPSVVGQTIFYNCPGVGVSNSLSNNPVPGQTFTMYATLNWASADKLYRRMTQYIITMDGNIWSRGYGNAEGTESTWTNWKKATTYSNEWVRYHGEDLADGTYSIQITVNSGYRIELGTLNLGGIGASERTSVGIDVYLNTVSLYYVQRENDGTLKVYSCGIDSTTATQQPNILIYYKKL